MKVYVSGAISGYDIEERKKVFGIACEHIKEEGHIPVNPFVNGLSELASYQEHMKADIKMLLDCDAIYLLKGWNHSEGAKVEYKVAEACGLKMIMEV